jgi:hypothetical protein
MIFINRIEGKTKDITNSKGFWRWCTSFGITELLDFSIFKYSERTRRFGHESVSVLKWKGGETRTDLAPLDRVNLDYCYHLRMDRDPDFLTSCSFRILEDGCGPELDNPVEGTEFKMNVLKNTIACRTVAK